MVRIDLHVHTNYSDGTDSVLELIRHAEKIGLDGIGVTDHDTTKGLYEAAKIKTNLLIVPGIEVSTSKGHIVGYGITGGDIDMGLTPEETIDIIHRMGGIAVPSHPFDIFRLGVKKRIYDLKIDAIEVINGNSSFGSYNKKAFFAARKLDLPMIAGSDGHCIEEIGNAWTDFLTPPETWEDVITMIKRKESIPYGSKQPLLISKFKRWIKAYKKRHERPAPYPWIKRRKKNQLKVKNENNDD